MPPAHAHMTAPTHHANACFLFPLCTRGCVLTCGVIPCFVGAQHRCHRAQTRGRRNERRVRKTSEVQQSGSRVRQMTHALDIAVVRPTNTRTHTNTHTHTHTQTQTRVHTHARARERKEARACSRHVSGEAYNRLHGRSHRNTRASTQGASNERVLA